MTIDRMQIGELSRRVGLSADALRAWERRYGLLQPHRTVGGYRVYGPQDERRVREVVALRAAGVPVSQAVTRVLGNERASVRADATARSAAPTRSLEELGDVFLDAVVRFDEPSAHGVLDELFATRSVEGVVEEWLLPLFRELGDRWAREEMTIGQEHFATHLVQRRLAAFSVTWGAGRGPIAVLACPSEELHDLPLLCFGMLLALAGWRIRLLGADTPIDEVDGVATDLRADAVVLAVMRPEPLQLVAKQLSALARRRVFVGGAGASSKLPRGTAALPESMSAAVVAMSEQVA